MSIRETDTQPPDFAPVVNELHGILLGEAYHLEVSPETLPQQLHNRLVESQRDIPAFTSLISDIRNHYHQNHTPWFRLVSDRPLSTQKPGAMASPPTRSSRSNHKSLTTEAAVVFSTDADFCLLSLSSDEHVAAVVEMPLGRSIGAISLWDSQIGKRISTINTFKLAEATPVALAWFPNCKQLLLAWSDGAISIWDSEMNRERTGWQLRKLITNAALSMDGRTLLVMTESRALMCDPLTGEQWMERDVSDFELDQIVMSRDSNFAVLGGKTPQSTPVSFQVEPFNGWMEQACFLSVRRPD